MDNEFVHVDVVFGLGLGVILSCMMAVLSSKVNVENWNVNGLMDIDLMSLNAGILDFCMVGNVILNCGVLEHVTILFCDIKWWIDDVWAKILLLVVRKWFMRMNGKQIDGFNVWFEFG